METLLPIFFIVIYYLVGSLIVRRFAMTGFLVYLAVTLVMFIGYTYYKARAKR